MARVEPEPNSGCWIWVGPWKDNGYGVQYGVASHQRKQDYAHRKMMRFVHGTIPDGLEVDHRCRNTVCVNPDHLEFVTRRENLLRGQTFAARNAQKTHCPHGHAYSPENTYVPPSGGRHCQSCLDKRARDAKAYNLRRTIDRGQWRNAKLTWSLVREMRTRRAQGESVKSLARQFGIAESTASNVLSGHRWREEPHEHALV